MFILEVINALFWKKDNYVILGPPEWYSNNTGFTGSASDVFRETGVVGRRSIIKQEKCIRVGQRFYIKSSVFVHSS